MAAFQSKREKILGSLTAIALLFGGGYFFVYQRAMALYDSFDADIRSAQKSWEEKKTRYKKSQNYKARFEKMRESLSLEGTEQEKRSQIAQELIKLLESVNIVATSLQEPQYEQVDDQFRIYSYNLRGIRTDRATLARLLYAIENSDAVLEVSSMNIKRGSGRSGDAELTIDLTISRLVEHEVKRKKSSKKI
jgi:hypothetical protein